MLRGIDRTRRKIAGVSLTNRARQHSESVSEIRKGELIFVMPSRLLTFTDLGFQVYSAQLATKQQPFTLKDIEMNTLSASTNQLIQHQLAQLRAAEATLHELAPHEHAFVWEMITRRLSIRGAEYDEDFALQIAKDRGVIIYSTQDDLLSIQEFNEAELQGQTVLFFTWNPDFYANKLGPEIEVRHVRSLFH